MDTAKIKKALEIFDSVVDLRPDQREAALIEHCGGDTELRTRVKRLLSDDADGLDDFMREPAFVPSTTTEADGTVAVPDRIGRYKILREIGEGGMGVVYLAEQTEPVTRQVALKVIKLGMDTRQVIARFETERQALAIMDHPSVAKMLDGGVTADGRPFFVTEYVPGVAITDFCDTHQLTVPQRLRVFLQVCQAVQHAHQKGVIHRDIKPSNLLVTEESGEPTPKVIDFGVAKAVREHLTKETLFTEHGQLIGTPAYMSPEQAAGGGQEIDTRTDIYSLGALLYELLCGTPPFDPVRLRESSYDQIRRIISEDEPPKPSTKLTRLASDVRSNTNDPAPIDGGTVAHRRGTALPSLARQLRGDLDWIALKAMDKDRTRRYESAASLAADIQCHLNHEPVAASPPSTVYRIRKFARRNRAVVVGTVAVVAALIAGLIGTSWAMLNASMQRDQAAAVSQFLQNMLTSANPKATGKPDLEVRELLDEAAREIERGSLEGQPLIEAAVRTILGTSYHALGLYETAELQLKEAVDIRERQLGSSHPDLATSLSHLAELLAGKGDYESAESYHRRALAMRRDLLPSQHRDIAQSLHDLGSLLHLRGRREEAELLHREALDMRRALPDADQRSVAQSLHGLGVVLMDQGQFDEAETLLRDALAIRRSTLHDSHPDLSATLLALVQLLNHTGRFLEAEPMCREAIKIARTPLGPEHRDVADAMNSLAAILKQKGEIAEATALFQESLEIFRKALGDDHPEVGAMLHNVAVAHNESGDYDRAVSMMQEAMEIFRKHLGEEHPNTAHCMHNLAVFLQNRGDGEAAESLFRQVLAIRQRTLGGRHPHVAFSLRELASALMLRKEYAEAERLLQEAIGIEREGLPQTRGSLAGAYAVLGQLLLDRGDVAEPESLDRMLR